MSNLLDFIHDYFVGVVLLVLLIVGLLIGMVVMDQEMSTRATVCILAGYAEPLHWHGEWYCIGVKDGELRVVSFDQVKEQWTQLGSP